MATSEETREETMEKLVIEEATKLRDMITQEEADRLEYVELNSLDTEKCIYGQLSGHCDNPRAVELIRACAARVYKAYNGVQLNLRDAPLNGSHVGLGRTNFWSPIEVFISQFENSYSGNNLRLVKFIKKEIDELIFE